MPQCIVCSRSPKMSYIRLVLNWLFSSSLIGASVSEPHNSVFNYILSAVRRSVNQGDTLLTRKHCSRPVLVSSPDKIFRARPADSSKNRVWTLSLRKLGQVYIRQAVNWVIVGVDYIICNQQRLLWRQKNLQAGYL